MNGYLKQSSFWWSCPYVSHFLFTSSNFLLILLFSRFILPHGWLSIKKVRCILSCFLFRTSAIEARRFCASIMARILELYISSSNNLDFSFLIWFLVALAFPIYIWIWTHLHFQVVDILVFHRCHASWNELHYSKCCSNQIWHEICNTLHLQIGQTFSIPGCGFSLCFPITFCYGLRLRCGSMSSLPSEYLKQYGYLDFFLHWFQMSYDKQKLIWSC